MLARLGAADVARAGCACRGLRALAAEATPGLLLSLYPHQARPRRMLHVAGVSSACLRMTIRRAGRKHVDEHARSQWTARSHCKVSSARLEQTAADLIGWGAGCGSAPVQQSAGAP